MWRKRKLHTNGGKYKLVESRWKAVWRFLKKLKVELPYDPAIPMLGMYPKRNQKH